MVGDIRNIIVIESLPAGELKTGEELYNDVIKRRIDYIQNSAIKMTHKYHSINSSQDLIDLFKFYGVNSNYMNGGIVIHFEMHGAESKRGFVLADDSFIGWEEVVDLLRIININTNDNLYLTLATCFGRYLFEGADLHKKSPYSGYISASKSIFVTELMESFTTLYEVLTDTGNLVYSYLELEKKGSNFYYKDSKATFETNFESFKNNVDFRNQIMNNVRESIAIKGSIIDEEDPIYDSIYEICLQKAYDEQLKRFKFD